jgi:hypothetical protein
VDWTRILDNRTPMDVRGHTFDDADGRELLVVIAKMVWEADPGGFVRLAHPGGFVRAADEPWDEPSSSIRYPSDFAAFKPGTDVILVGTAHPPRAGSTHVDVSLKIGDGRRLRLQKTLRVHGPRLWERSGLRVAPGAAAALEPTPLRYELAWGGAEIDDEGTQLEPRNPRGSGATRDPSRLVGTLAPVIETLEAPIGSRRPSVAGFGPIEPGWEPRRARAGTRDALWQRERAPLPPVDRDPRFSCCAPDDQWLAEPLRGDEDVEVLHVGPAAAWRFSLPRYEPAFSARILGVEHVGTTHLDTMVLDADAGRVELVWRARFPMPLKSEQVEWARVVGRPALDEQLIGDLTERVLRIPHEETA